MKFLLCAINAKYIHSNPAVYSLRAYAGEVFAPFIELAEYTINQRTEDILEDIYRRKPDAIGFSCYIWNWETVQGLLSELPKISPGADLWLGGPQVSYSGAQILEKYPQVTGIMVGEGEATFRELMQEYQGQDMGAGQRDFSHIAGLYLSGGYTGERPLLDMDELPFYYENLDEFANRIIYYESSRGCPYRCSYCLSSIDRKVRLRSMALVERELQFFLDRRVPQVKFIDRTFNCNHAHGLAIWRYLLAHDNGVTNFHFEISADLLTKEELAVLGQMRPGLAQLEIGMQSTNPDTIAAISRHMDLEKLEENVAAVAAGHNIHRHLDLIAGLPFEDYESFAASFNRVYEMAPQQLQLGFLKVLSGSPMEEQAKEYGICYQDKPPYEVLYTRWLSYAEVRRLKGVEEMVELYYNSGQFPQTLKRLERAFSSPFALYEALADYYREKGYQLNSPARAYRYQVLLEFACEADPANRVCYPELLTYDLYLREKVKSRPDWCPPREPYRERYRDFYRQEEASRRYLPDYEQYDARQLEKMTHLELFSQFGPVLFDYRRRDPLTGNAGVLVVEEL